MDAKAADTFLIRRRVTGDQTHQSVLTFNLWHYQVDLLSARSTTHMIALYKTSSPALLTVIPWQHGSKPFSRRHY